MICHHLDLGGRSYTGMAAVVYMQGGGCDLLVIHERASIQRPQRAHPRPQSTFLQRNLVKCAFVMAKSVRVSVCRTVSVRLAHS